MHWPLRQPREIPLLHRAEEMLSRRIPASQRNGIETNVVRCYCTSVRGFGGLTGHVSAPLGRLRGDPLDGLPRRRGRAWSADAAGRPGGRKIGCAAGARAVTMGHMPWFLSDSLPEYSSTVGGLLARRPAQHTILLGAIETLRAAGPAVFGAIAPHFGWWQGPDGEVSAACLHIPPFGVALTSVPAPASAALAQALVARRRTVNGVNADPTGAEAFARAWHELTGDAIELHMRSRLYQLGDLHRSEERRVG